GRDVQAGGRRVLRAPHAVHRGAQNPGGDAVYEGRVRRLTGPGLTAAGGGGVVVIAPPSTRRAPVGSLRRGRGDRARAQATSGGEDAVEVGVERLARTHRSLQLLRVGLVVAAQIDRIALDHRQLLEDGVLVGV